MKSLCRLVISDCAVEDEGKYTAKIEGEEVSALLAVQDFVEILTPLKDLTLTEKDDIKLRVVISDKNEPGNWYKDGTLVVPGETIIIEVCFKNNFFLI